MMKAISLLASGLILGLLVLVFSPNSEAQSSETALRVNGAAIACDQVQRWANEFMQKHPDSRIVVYGSSAGKGFDALIEGKAEIALGSRSISEEEKRKAQSKNMKLESKLICYSGLGVMTHPRNNVSELTMEELRKVFTGDYTNWKEVGGPDAPIRCLTRRVPESGGAVFFMEEVLHRPYGPATVMADSWTSIAKVCSVATDVPIGIGPALAAKNGTKLLAVKLNKDSPGIKPSQETMKDGSYPIIVPIQMYWDSQSQDPRIKPFVDFCAEKGLPKQ